MISSRPRRWSIKGIKSQILFNTNSLVFGKHVDKVVNFQIDSETQLDEVQEQLSLFRVSNPRKRRLVLLSRNWVTHKSCRAVKRASKRRSGNSWRKKISGVNRKRQRCTAAHVQTPALLTQTEAALKDAEEKCVSLEEELRVKLAERGELQGDLWKRRGEKGAGWPVTPVGGKSPTVDSQRGRARGYAPGKNKNNV